MANSPETTYTLEQFIETGVGSFRGTYANLSIIKKSNYRKRDIYSDDEILYTELNFINDYMEEIMENAILVKLDHKEQLKYKYAPDLLAYDIYGSTEFGYILMLVNGIVNPDDFVMERVYLFSQEVMSEIISTIYNSERNYIVESREENDLPTEGL